jgi:ATP-dependent Clp protease protease subunit
MTARTSRTEGAGRRRAGETPRAVRPQRKRPGAGRQRDGATLGSSDSDAKETDVNDLLRMDGGAPVARSDGGPNLGLNDSIYNRLLKERIIWLGTEVRDDNANAICAQMMLLAAEDPDKDIYLYINSPGGSITAGMAIYDTMQFIQPDVATVGMGMAASMGQFLLSSGAKGKRYATPHARVMMHQPSGGIGGTATDVRINAELIMHMKKVLAELTSNQTGQSLEKVLKDSDRDKWFTADQALEYGFVDHVVASASSVSGGGGTTAS